MAIKHLHHLDLNLNQLKNTKLEIAGSDPSHVSTDEGRIIYNSGSNALKFNNGTEWITLDGSGDISGITAGNGLTLDGGTGLSGNVTVQVETTVGSGISVGANAISITTGGITAAMLAADAVETAKIKDGNVTLAKMANLAENNFIGRKTASAGVPETLTATEVRTILNVEDGANAYDLPTASASVKGGIKVGTTLGIASQVLNVDTESIQDIVGAMVSGNTESDITVTYQDGDGTIDFSVDNTVLKTTGDYTMGGALTITGNLTVNGTTTTVNSSTVSVEDNMFEMANGNTAADSLDIGWYGLYLDGSTQKYATIFRDAAADTFRVGSTITAPGNTVTDFTLGKFEAGEFIGDLTGNATTATTLASSRSFSITGDGSATGVSFNGSSAVTLNLVLDTVNSGAGSFGSASETATFTVNGKGLVTASTEQSIQITSSQVTDFNADAVSAVRSANSYAANIGSATLSAVTVNHALGSQDVIVQVRNVASPYEAYMVEIEYTDANNVEIKTSAALGLNAARVMITRVG
jgi:hypothetical protein